MNNCITGISGEEVNDIQMIHHNKSTQQNVCSTDDDDEDDVPVFMSPDDQLTDMPLPILCPRLHQFFNDTNACITCFEEALPFIKELETILVECKLRIRALDAKQVKSNYEVETKEVEMKEDETKEIETIGERCSYDHLFRRSIMPLHERYQRFLQWYDETVINSQPNHVNKYRNVFWRFTDRFEFQLTQLEPLLNYITNARHYHNGQKFVYTNKTLPKNGKYLRTRYISWQQIIAKQNFGAFTKRIASSLVRPTKGLLSKKLSEKMKRSLANKPITKEDARIVEMSVRTDCVHLDLVNIMPPEVAKNPTDMEPLLLQQCLRQLQMQQRCNLHTVGMLFDLSQRQMYQWKLHNILTSLPLDLFDAYARYQSPKSTFTDHRRLQRMLSKTQILLNFCKTLSFNQNS